jgi:hypothetical protein
MTEEEKRGMDGAISTSVKRLLYFALQGGMDKDDLSVRIIHMVLTGEGFNEYVTRADKARYMDRLTQYLGEDLAALGDIIT